MFSLKNLARKGLNNTRAIILLPSDIEKAMIEPKHLQNTTNHIISSLYLQACIVYVNIYI